MAETRTRRTLAQLRCAHAETTGTIASLSSRPSMGTRIRLAIVVILHPCDAPAGAGDSRKRIATAESTRRRRASAYWVAIPATEGGRDVMRGFLASVFILLVL